MALERKIIKSSSVAATTFDFKPSEISDTTSMVAKDFVHEDAFRSPHFKISELIARQAGILQMENEVHQDKINAQVLDRLKEVQEKAYAEGHALGLKEGAERAFEEMKGVLVERMRTMETLIKTIEDLKTRLLVDNEAGLIRLVYLVANRIAMRDLEQNHEAVKEILTSVISELQADESIVVKMSTDDLKFIESLQEKAGEKIESLERAKLVAQADIKRGGCVIETEFGSVNATVEERVDRVWQTLESRIPHNREIKND